MRLPVAAGILAMLGLLASPLTAGAAGGLQRLSTDPFTNPSSQHATEVEPDIASHGSTLVGVFQTGRVAAGGSADIGWATSTDSGATWTHGFLPGITRYQGHGPNSAVSDPAVTFDARHARWLVVSLTIGTAGNGVDVSASPDGLHWARPVVVTSPAGLDKTWITCDASAQSPHYGTCYTEWDNASSGDVVFMSRSTDGGATWSVPVHPVNANGLGGQPLVRPDGTVVVPFLADAGVIESFTSGDGGSNWGSLVSIAGAASHIDPGGMRSGPLPSAAIDAAGTVYVTWQSCLFESGCSTNDLVLAHSTNGTAWSAAQRVPVTAPGTRLDAMIPGIGADATTSGHLGIVYYSFSDVGCSAATCRLDVGFISSADGGATWSVPQPLAGPMKMSWIANSQNGRMVGDYFATAFAGGRCFPIFAVGVQPHRGAAFDEAMYTAQGGIAV